MGPRVLSLLPCFLGNIFFHLLLINTVYMWGLGQEPGRGGQGGPGAAGSRSRAGGGAWPTGWAGPLLTRVLGTVPSVETHGSYGFGLFPQFSVGLAWPAPCSPTSGTGISGAAGHPGVGVQTPGHLPGQRGRGA